MSGKFSGVQASFRNLTGSPCIYVHCHAHRVNLVLVDTCSSVTAAGDLFGLLEAIHNFVTVSSIRHEKFVDIQKDRHEKVMELPLLSDTRWVCKLKAVTTFKNRFQSVVLTLLYFTESGKPRERAEAKGLLAQLMSPSTVFMLYLFEELLLLTNSVNTYCQNKSACMSNVCAMVKATIQSLEAMRNNLSFDRLFDEVAQKCSQLGIEVEVSSVDKTVLTAKRTCRQPQHLKDSIIMTTLGRRNVVPPENTNSDDSSRPEAPGCKQLLKKQMFEILDCMKGELSRRFCVVEPILLSCDSVNPKSDLFLDFDTMKPLTEAYAYLGIDANNLKAQAVVAKTMFQQQCQDKVSSTQDVLQVLLSMECAFLDLVVFTKLVLTIPVSSAGAERSFSTMKRVKNYLRSTMSDNRLSNLCIISIEREMSDKLLSDTRPVVDGFASQRKRRLTM